MADPISSIVACISLISTIGRTSSGIASFVRSYRALPSDLDNMSRDLTPLRNVLSLLKDNFATVDDQAVPETIRKEIIDIISNCRRVLEELDELLQRHNGGLSQALRWATTGSQDAAKLRWNLDAYRGTLHLALELLKQHKIGEIKQDTSQILAKVSLLSAPLPAEEFRTQGLEVSNDINGENDRRDSKSSILSCTSEDTLTSFPPDIQNEKRRNSGTGFARLFSSFRSSPSPIQLKDHRHWVLSVAFSRDGKLIASGSRDGTVRVWDPFKGECRGTFDSGSGCVRDVSFSPDGKLIASASFDNTVWLWNVATGKKHARYKGHKGSVHAVVFSPDGKLVTSSSSDHTVRLWDPGTGLTRWTFEGHNGSIWAVAFSPNGKLVASASRDKTVRLWDVNTGQCYRTFEDHGDEVRAVTFSPDGNIVASASHDRTMRLWDPATGSVGRICKGHKGNVHAVAFSPDGKLVASASLDNTVRLWDVATGQFRGMLLGHKDSVQAVAFSPDGKIIASSSNDRTIRLWEPAMAEM